MNTNPLVLTGANTLAVMVPTWSEAVVYLVRRPGQWVSSVELADHVYGGVCSRQAVHMLVRRARLAGIPIESNRHFGYRIGRDRSRLCGRCGSMKVRYDGEEVCYGCVGTEFVDLEVGRAGYDRASQQGRPWTEEERAVLRRLWPQLSQEEIARQLSRTASSVRAEGRNLALGRKPYRRGER